MHGCRSPVDNMLTAGKVGIPPGGHEVRHCDRYTSDETVVQRLFLYMFITTVSVLNIDPGK